MTSVRHLSCGSLHVPPNPKVICHCLLLEDKGRFALIDTGIGLEDVRRPVERLGQTLIDMAGFLFHEEDTAIWQIERLGFRAEDVTDIVLTHGDPDHAGGLADFPNARVHLSQEERANIDGGGWRYVPIQFAHGPRWQVHPSSSRSWFGLEARSLELGFESETLLIPLFGHTLGHCGVAVRQGDRWLLHVGDAYYLRVETAADDHPVSLLAAQRADDDALRRAGLERLRRLIRDHGGEVEMFGYHDPSEFPTPR